MTEETTLEHLARYEVRESSDEAKTDRELVCTQCSSVVCDVEAGDVLSALAAMALDHRCNSSA